MQIILNQSFGKKKHTAGSRVYQRLPSPSITFVTIASVLRGYFNGLDKVSITAKSQSLEQVFKTLITILAV